MRRFYIKQILLTIAVLLCSLKANAFEVDGIYYNIISSTDFTVEVIPFYYTGDIFIPSTVTYDGDEYRVISIRDYAFNGNTSLTSVTFGENSQLEEIGVEAFRNCSSLTSIEIPSLVTSIGRGVFCECSSLTNIEIPNSVTSIGRGAFAECSSLTGIIIPNSVASIEDAAFGGCSTLTSVTFGENSQLTEIGVEAFRNCSSLTSIEIPSLVTSIGRGAFSECSSLTSIEIPNSVTSIDRGSYDGSGHGAFEGCSSLTSVTFGENSQLIRIGMSAFEDCSSLANIEIPNSVTDINSRAFVGCSGLTSIEIPSSVTYIGSSTFYNCSSLASVTFGENSQLEEIGSNAFEGCTSLTSIAIPNPVTYIEEEAFDKCTSLKELFIEDGYTTLELEEDCLFSDCPLETIYLGRNLSFDESEDSPFKNIKTLKTLTVGADVTEILGKTFYDCSNLESIYMKGVPPIITDDTFSNTSYYVTTLYVPQGTLAFYQSANVWKNFWNIQEYEPTSIEDIETDEVNFSITSNGISLLNADNRAVAIYSINGILVEKIDKYTGEEIVLNKGVYIVCVGDKAVKIKL